VTKICNKSSLEPLQLGFRTGRPVVAAAAGHAGGKLGREFVATWKCDEFSLSVGISVGSMSVDPLA